LLHAELIVVLLALRDYLVDFPQDSLAIFRVDKLYKPFDRRCSVVLFEPEPPTCRLIAVDPATRGVALAFRAYGGALPPEGVEGDVGAP